MQKAVPFGEWLPDIAPSNSNHVIVAWNVYPMANGYAPVGGLETITPTIGEAFLGGGSFASSTGVYTLLAGTASKLRKYASATWSNILTGLTISKRWYFAQFGDNIVYANGGQLGRYQLIPGTAAVIAGAPTNAIDVATVGDFVMAVLDDGNIQWSSFNDCTAWTPGTNQADKQPLLDGGPGVRIVGGQYGIVFQRNCVRRIQYTGQPDIWFQIDKISPEIGCMAGGSVAYTGRLIFFLSERGFEMCDGENVAPIADEKFNRWFFANFSRSDIANMWSAIDPRNAFVMWAVPGNPGLIIVYSWTLKRGTALLVNHSAVFTGLTDVVSIDQLDSIYGDLDSVPISVDDPSLAGGNPVLMVVDNDYLIGALSGTNLEATIRQNNIELTPGRRSRVRSVRPITDALNASVGINAKMKAGDGESIRTTSEMRSNGKMPIRANGRYLDNILTIPAGETWSYVQGCEYEFEPGDGR
jgi:hypothetical protein